MDSGAGSIHEAAHCPAAERKDQDIFMCKYSVIVPVYKVEKELPRCIESILNQTLTDFELILVDDGSPDRSGIICDQYASADPRIRVIHQENGGLSAARNAGIEWVLSNSSSEWITFIDSDDWVHSQYLEALYHAVLKYNTSISMCWSFRTSGEDTSPTSFDAVLRSVEDAYTLNGKTIASFACGRLYRKELFANYRFPEGKLWEDMYVIHKIMFQFPQIAVVEQPLYYYYRNPNGIIMQKWSERRKDIFTAYEEELFPFFKRKYPSVYRLAQSGYYAELTTAIEKANDAGYPEDAKELKRKLRKSMIRFHCLTHFPIKDNYWIYERAFPLFMSVYWLARAALKKFHIHLME